MNFTGTVFLVLILSGLLIYFLKERPPKGPLTIFSWLNLVVGLASCIFALIWMLWDWPF